MGKPIRKNSEIIPIAVSENCPNQNPRVAVALVMSKKHLSDVQVADSCFLDTTKATATRYIPAGRTPVLGPNFPAEAEGIANGRDELLTLIAPESGS